MDVDRETVDSHLRLFSEDGLRTLMLAVREVSGSVSRYMVVGYGDGDRLNGQSGGWCVLVVVYGVGASLI